LHLGGTANLAFVDFLGGSLLVETAVKDGPVEFAGIFLGQKVGSAFSVQEAEEFVIGTDKDFAASGINLGTGKIANFGPKFEINMLRYGNDASK
jgi:hypothetical protein